jgi:uncharacterized sulfatase
MPPNILFAFADDWGRYAGAYRSLDGPGTVNDIVETPNFDRVAREGVVFRNAFVPAPSCTPCRSSILAGQYFWQTGLGAILQGAVWDERIPSYPLELEKAGYHIGYAYKVWGPGREANAPYGANRTRYEPAGHNFYSFSQFVTERARTMPVNEAKQLLLDEVRQNFDAFLAARPNGAPVCYWWGPTNTHRKWERGSGHAVWGLDPDALSGRLPPFLPDVPEIREDVCDYLGECQAVDAGLGVLIERLEEIGELENTLIVVSGDHGIPGIPRGKCNLYDIGCEVALAARWPGRISPGRVADDMVNLMDLAPTFLQAADVAVPSTMSATSLIPLFESGASGQVNASRTFVVTGRERHVASAREGRLPYPQRAIRTRDYLYIRNFAPDRWPMGDPRGLDDPTAPPPSYDELASQTFVAYADLDASPTKAWMIHHRGEEAVKPAYELGFGKRPAEELYDLHADPHHLHNLAADSAYETIRVDLAARLMQVLQQNDDPRVSESPPRFEREPYTADYP